MTKNEYIKALRELADFIESKDFPDSWKGSYLQNSFDVPYLSLYVYDKEVFGAMCRELGSFEKEHTSYHLSALKKLTNGAKLTVNISKDYSCKKIVLGTKIVPATEDQVIPGKPEHEVEEVSYECPESFVALAETQGE
jgi:hypothetical protein